MSLHNGNHILWLTCMKCDMLPICCSLECTPRMHRQDQQGYCWMSYAFAALQHDTHPLHVPAQPFTSMTETEVGACEVCINDCPSSFEKVQLKE